MYLCSVKGTIMLVKERITSLFFHLTKLDCILSSLVQYSVGCAVEYYTVCISGWKERCI